MFRGPSWRGELGQEGAEGRVEGAAERRRQREMAAGFRCRQNHLLPPESMQGRGNNGGEDGRTHDRIREKLVKSVGGGSK